MKILITGSLGYLGPSVIRQLKVGIPDVSLIGFDAGFFSSSFYGARILPESLLSAQFFGDVRRFPEELLNGVDAVVALAAISNDPMGDRFEKPTMEINHKANIELAKKAKAKGVESFVFASSCSVYGQAGEGARTEESDVNPLTAYAKSKVYTERDLESLADGNFLVTCLRFSTACGFTERLRLDLVLNDFVANAILTGKIKILSDGSPWRPLINTKDMARAIKWAILRKPENGGNYLVVNVGSDEWNYQIMDLAYAVKDVMPGVDVDINENAEPDKRSYKVSFVRFKELAPNYQPVNDLVSTVRELREGLTSFGFSNSDFRNSTMIRLKALEGLIKSNILNSDLTFKNRGSNAF